MTWTFAWELLRKSTFPESDGNPLGAAHPLRRRSPAWEVASGRDRGDPEGLSVGKPPRSAGSEPSSAASSARKQGAPPALQARAPLAALQPQSEARWPWSCICLPPAPRRLVALGSAWSPHSWGSSSCAPAGFGNAGSTWWRRASSPSSSWSQAFRPRLVINIFLPSWLGPTKLTAERCYGSTCVFGIGGPNEEEGSEGAGALGAGPSLAVRQGPQPYDWSEVLDNSKDFDLGKAGTCWYKVLSGRFSLCVF